MDLVVFPLAAWLHQTANHGKRERTMLEPLLNVLRTEGHLRGEVSPPKSSKAGKSCWIIPLQVICGWLTALFIQLFFGMGAAPLIKGAEDWICRRADDDLAECSVAGVARRVPALRERRVYGVASVSAGRRMSGRAWCTDCRRQPTQQGCGKYHPRFFIASLAIGLQCIFGSYTPAPTNRSA